MTERVLSISASSNKAIQRFRVQFPTLVILAVLSVIIGSTNLNAQVNKRKPTVVKRDTNDAQIWITQNIDEMEGDTTYYSKEYIVISAQKADQGLRVAHYFHQTYGYYSTSIYTFGADNCMDKEARVLFLFTDGSKLEVTGDNDFNCDRHARFQLSEEELDVFVAKSISRVRVYTYKGSVEASLTPELARDWRTTLRHLASLKGR